MHIISSTNVQVVTHTHTHVCTHAYTHAHTLAYNAKHTHIHTMHKYAYAQNIMWTDMRNGVFHTQKLTDFDDWCVKSMNLKFVQPRLDRALL